MRESNDTILLVDDNDATCVLIKAILRHSHECEMVSDGLEALERLRTRRYAAVLLDLRMPKLNGFEVLAALKEEMPDELARVIVVTASLTPDEVQRANEYGICSIVRKPFDVETLVAAVAKCAEPKKSTVDLFSAGPAMMILFADLLRQRFF